MFSVFRARSLTGALHCFASSELKKKLEGFVSAGSPFRRRSQLEKNCCSEFLAAGPARKLDAVLVRRLAGAHELFFGNFQELQESLE
jgi:hypothetical protein